MYILLVDFMNVFFLVCVVK